MCFRRSEVVCEYAVSRYVLSESVALAVMECLTQGRLKVDDTRRYRIGKSVEVRYYSLDSDCMITRISRESKLSRQCIGLRLCLIGQDMHI